MANGTAKSLLKYKDVSVAIAATNPVSVAVIPSGSSGSIVSCAFNYNTDFYYATDKGSDNRVLTLSISSTGKSLVIVQGNNIPSTTRNLSVRVWYID